MGASRVAILSIQALKGVSIGDAFDVAGVPGSEAHDEIFHSPERGYYRETNRAGGLEGGMTNGQPLIVRGAMKPLPTLTKPLRSVDIATLQPAEALRERTDSCTVPAAAVVGEAMVALVLANAYRAKFGGDHIDDVREALRAYEERIGGGVRSPLLIGFMGAGKSRAATALAAARGAQALDSDELLEDSMGHSIAQEFELHGEEAFRAKEEELVCGLLAEAEVSGSGSVIALGGGSVLSERVRQALKPHLTVLVDVDPQTAWERASGAGASPGARSRELLRALRGAPCAVRGARRRDPAVGRRRIRRVPGVRRLGPARRRRMV